MDELNRDLENRYDARGVIVTEGESSCCTCPSCQTVIVASRDAIRFALTSSGWEFREYAGYVCRRCIERDQLE